MDLVEAASSTGRAVSMSRSISIGVMSAKPLALRRDQRDGRATLEADPRRLDRTDAGAARNFLRWNSN
ncbi:hypothetical protein [Bradyrhizobium ganzhouense]|uniref:hypothetical protein n=1 Tax=Bradyrhizobium ganzhouense TaxID=1179767 RepID=UPI003CE88C1C